MTHIYVISWAIEQRGNTEKSEESDDGLQYYYYDIITLIIVC